MKIAVAQIESIAGNITANIEKHIKFIEQASSLNAASIFFPELSITGYEPHLAEALATTADDSRLQIFQDRSDSLQIMIGVGLPTRTITGIRISMVIFQPKKASVIYSKQQVHNDELPFFENGNDQIIITVEEEKIAPAICYESLQLSHSEMACAQGATIYVASVAKTQNGVNKGMIHYPEVAQKFSIPVLMSNCIGVCDDFVGAGQSAVWSKSGQLAAQMDDKVEGLLIFDTETEEGKIYVI